MLLNKSALSFLILTAALTLPQETAADNLRNPFRKLARKATKCTILISVDLRLDPKEDLGEGFACEFDEANSPQGIGGLAYPIRATPTQMSELRDMLRGNSLVSGKHELDVGQMGASFNGMELRLPPTARVPEFVNLPEQAGRRLAVTKGNKPILLIKVYDVNGLTYGHTAAVMSDNVFGGNGDQVNLKSQMFACSFGQLNILPANSTTIPVAAQIANAPGTIEVSVTADLKVTDRYTFRNAVNAAAAAKLGFSLPGPYQQVMHSVAGCYLAGDCGWAAYAYVNSWNSVYQAQYYLQVGVQMHELGHNFNLAHSGGLDGQTYTDHTCLMGNPLYSDEVGKMCFNPAKNFQLDWYNDAERTITLPALGSESFSVVGVADYANPARNGLPVTVKLETGTVNDFFIGYNRAIGVNAQNDEADNEVTVVQTGNNGVGYSQSFLKATLLQGESVTLLNWRGTGQDLTIVADVINLSADPAVLAVATITTYEGPRPITPSPNTAPTSAPTVPATPPPTVAPTAAPTSAPTIPATPPPTVAPTPTLATNPPTAAPTNPPAAACATISSKASCVNALDNSGALYCTWSGSPTSGSCSAISGGGGGTAAPTAAPGAGTGGGGCGTCSSYGSNKVACLLCPCQYDNRSKQCV